VDEGKYALLSPDQKYRYVLTRTWSDDVKQKLVIIGLNPSTADAFVDDPTIRRCIRFAKDWGFDQLIMLNIFALRSTDPELLKGELDPIGPENDRLIDEYLEEAHMVLVAWGANEMIDHNDRADHVLLRIREPYCLGTTMSGHPRHPLYIKADTKPFPYKG
jgi:hypothetical protein